MKRKLVMRSNSLADISYLDIMDDQIITTKSALSKSVSFCNELILKSASANETSASIEDTSLRSIENRCTLIQEKNNQNKLDKKSEKSSSTKQSQSLIELIENEGDELNEAFIEAIMFIEGYNTMVKIVDQKRFAQLKLDKFLEALLNNQQVDNVKNDNENKQEQSNDDEIDEYVDNLFISTIENLFKILLQVEKEFQNYRLLHVSLITLYQEYFKKINFKQTHIYFMELSRLLISINKCEESNLINVKLIYF
jgi:hypothetical protein